MVSTAKGSKLTGFKGTLENSSKQFVTVGYTIAYKTSLEKPKPQNTNKKSVKTLYSVQNSFLDLTNLFEVEWKMTYLYFSASVMYQSNTAVSGKTWTNSWFNQLSNDQQNWKVTSALWITCDFCLIKNSYAKALLRNQGEVCYQECNEDKRAEKSLLLWEDQLIGNFFCWQNKMRESNQTSLTPTNRIMTAENTIFLRYIFMVIAHTNCCM